MSVARVQGQRAQGGGVGSVEGRWMGSALCRTVDADDLFVQGAAQSRAKALCTGCPVKAECLAYALDGRIEYGVWGGMTERERRALLKRRPTVQSWGQLLDAARRRSDNEGAAPQRESA
ncbi:WhiB family transcriptional regulator [Streptomyces sp. NPDC058700]|uniref:WhiB family transcriptional regulator n=1 Tax=unclassified Streptomyces TaxID=2593676 RepID=UPI003646044F